ncbi:MAG: NAD(P)/FAD-dependent oxidoreductase [Ardenticatenia bacterium]|nr:NAD(P)/FAD-dependent oxidoreductase [Ardenticatenia bacterium]
MRYDVIIAGASFAGLAVAAQLRGKRVLVLDRKPIGEGQTSACGTLVSTLQALGLEDSILHLHDRLVVHTPGRTYVYPMPEPFCTFDYPQLCHLLWRQGDAEFIQAPALGVEGKSVRTPAGEYTGRFIVDASGWRAALGTSLDSTLVRRDRLNFGLETTPAYQDDGLHFWYDPKGLLPMGITWVFPIGDFSRIGVGSYLGDTRLMSTLTHFLGRLQVERNGFHGGFFPYQVRDPLLGELFLVGDAAGQCLALTGEGIRPALFFGTHVGRLLRMALDGEITPEEARLVYRRLVLQRKGGYDLLTSMQLLLPRVPLVAVQGAFALVALPPLLRRILDRYLRAFALDETFTPANT